MKIGSRNGSLLVTVLFVIVIALVAGSLLSLSLTSQRLTTRNELRARARAVAESELEHMFFLFKDQIQRGKLPGEIPGMLRQAGLADEAATPITDRSAYLVPHQAEEWTVRRSMDAVGAFDGIDPYSRAKGNTTYVDVRVEISPPPGTNASPVRYGRQFSTSVSTIFQNCIFYEGDLEMAPGGNTVITGDIVCNGSIYMGANGGGTLTLKKNVTYLKGFGFNTDPGADKLFGTSDDSTGLGPDATLGTADDIYTVYRKPGTPTGGTLNAPDFFYSQAQQLKEMDVRMNLLNGADPKVIQELRPDLFPTINDVFRSVIVPPPGFGGTNEYPSAVDEDPVMSATRMYNRAGLIVTVGAAGAVTVTKVNPETGVRTVVPPNDPATTTLADIVAGTTTMWDKREGRDVTVTEIDVAVLKKLVGDTRDSPSSVYEDFNGLLYVNLQTGDSTSPSAVRLVNAGATPRTGTDPVKHGTDGFSVVTNGGLYVKGDYNTLNNDGLDLNNDGLYNDPGERAPTRIPDGTSPPRSMLMGDALTVLSADWDDADSSAGIASRVAGHDVTINAGILVGNTAALEVGDPSAPAGQLSGGVQNLVRYLEDWEAHSVIFNGSLGRLFESKIFTRAYTQPSSGDVYRIPSNRTFNFDDGLTEGGGPPGSIKTTAISRGRFYYW